MSYDKFNIIFIFQPKSSPKIPSTPAQKASTQAKKPAKKKETKPKSRPAKATKRVGKTPTAAKKGTLNTCLRC